MRFACFFFVIIHINNYAQNSNQNNESYPIFPICKLLPESKLADCFEESIQEHIDNYFFYPKQAWDLDLQAVVRIRFDINESGDIDNIAPKASVVGVSFREKESLNAAKQLFQISASEILKSLPKMTPAKVNGIPVNKSFQVSIDYRIPNESSLEEVSIAPLIKGCEEKVGEESAGSCSFLGAVAVMAQDHGGICRADGSALQIFAGANSEFLGTYQIGCLLIVVVRGRG